MWYVCITVPFKCKKCFLNSGQIKDVLEFLLSIQVISGFEIRVESNGRINSHIIFNYYYGPKRYIFEWQDVYGMLSFVNGVYGLKLLSFLTINMKMWKNQACVSKSILRKWNPASCIVWFCSITKNFGLKQVHYPFVKKRYFWQGRNKQLTSFHFCALWLKASCLGGIKRSSTNMYKHLIVVINSSI